jgi:hypothetical protein
MSEDGLFIIYYMLYVDKEIYVKERNGVLARLGGEIMSGCRIL